MKNVWLFCCEHNSWLFARWRKCRKTVGS